MVFEYSVANNGNYAVISLSGNLIEKSQATALLEEADVLAKQNCNRWAINLEDLAYMNSSGLNTLIQLLTKARVGGGEAVLYNMNKKINELILITRLHTLFKVAESETDALAILAV
jgi:anti-sigma B factor antagonist